MRTVPSDTAQTTNSTETDSTESAAGIALERERSRRALLESEAKYRTLFESMDDAFCVIEMIFDESGKPVDFLYRETNPAFERHATRPMLGKRIREIVPDIEQSWLEHYGRVATSGEVVRLDGVVAELGDQWFQTSAFRLGGEDSRLVAVLFANITERKRHEENLSFLAEVSQDLARMTDARETMSALAEKIGTHFQLAYCAFAELDGPAGVAIVTHDWHPAGRPDITGVYRIDDYVTEEWRQAMQTGEVVVVRDVGPDPRADTEQFAALGIGSFLCVPLVRDGQWRFTLNLYDAQARDWQDEEIELVRELTTRIWTRLERTRAEEAVRASEARLQRAIDIETVGVIFFDPAGHITGANDAFLRMGGYPREDLVAGRLRWDRLTPPEWMPASLRAAEQLQATGSTVPYEKEYFRHDGSRWWGLFAARKLSETEGVEFILDITEGKRAEAARHHHEVARALEEHIESERRRIGRELHDSFRQQLAGVTMLSAKLSEKLEARGAPEAALMREYSKLIADTNSQLRGLIHNLVPDKVDADALPSALRRTGANLEQWYGVCCEFHGRARDELTDETANHLFHIAQEAMTNAAKHGEGKQIDVFLRTEEGAFVLEVHDDGQGLPDDFEKRGGMGLTNMRYRAELIGGYLRFERGRPRGSIVSCRLPL